MKNEDNVEIESGACPYSEDKVCIQLDNVKELRELIGNTANKVGEVKSDMENVKGEVGLLSDELRVLTSNVIRISENIDKVFKLHFDKALSDKDEFGNLKIKDVELEKMISDIAYKSEIDNMMQDHNITNSELEKYKGKSKDRKTLWQKVQLTFIGLSIAWLFNWVIGVLKDIWHLLQTTPK